MHDDEKLNTINGMEPASFGDIIEGVEELEYVPSPRPRRTFVQADQDVTIHATIDMVSLTCAECGKRFELPDGGKWLSVSRDGTLSCDPDFPRCECGSVSAVINAIHVFGGKFTRTA